MTSPGAPAPATRVAARVCGAYAVAVGATTLLGWAGAGYRLTDWDGNGISMKPNAALVALGAGAALLCGPRLQGLAVGCALLVAALGLVTLSQHAFGWDAGIDTLLFDETPGARATAAPGRMGPPASLSSFLLGAGLALARGRPGSNARRVAPWLGLAAATIGAMSLTGYLLGANLLYDVPRLTGISLQMTTVVVALSAGLLAAVSDAGPVALLTGGGPGGVLSRRLLLVGALVPLAGAAIGAVLVRRGAADAPGALALLVVISVLATAVAVLSGAASVRRAEQIRDRAARQKDEFLATLSHELRTPLSTVLGWTVLCRQDLANAPRVAQGLEIVERNARLQAQLVDDLLDVSRIVTGKLELRPGEVDLAALVTASVDAARPGAQARGLTLAAEVGAAAPVRADGARLQQVVGNLLSNAVKFTPPGGRIDVRLEHAGTRARLTVKDSGEGIRPEFLPHVFERFRQDDASPSRRHSGLGIGLSLVRDLVTLHGGDVAVESDGPGRGATFTVTLPLAAK